MINSRKKLCEEQPYIEVSFQGEKVLLMVDSGCACKGAICVEHPAAAPVPKSAQSQMWDKLQVNKMVCFVMKGDNPANLRTAEVISLADDKRSGEFWFWIDGSGTYRSDMSLEYVTPCGCYRSD